MHLPPSAARAFVVVGFCVAPLLSFAQQKKPVARPAKVAAATPAAPAVVDANPYQLQWQGKRLLAGADGRRYYLPEFPDMEVRPGERLPYYKLALDGRVTAFELRQARYEAFTEAEGKLLDAARVSAQPAFEITMGQQQRQWVSFVTWAPVRRNPTTGTLEKLVSFDYQATFGTAPAQRRTSSSHATTSVLAQGTWVKIGVGESGLYRIDRNQLRTLGLNPDNLDARNLQLWGNGGRMLPQPNAAPRADDLVENAILVDETNGSFNSLTFYAQGPNGWNYSAADRRFSHEHNVYSDSSYYFLTVGTGGRRVATETGPGAATLPKLTTFDEHVYHEIEKSNLLLSGRDWYGEEFNSFSTAQTFTYDMPGLVSTGSMLLTANTLANIPSGGGQAFTWKLNSQQAGIQSVAAMPGSDYPPLGQPAVNTYAVPMSSVGTGAALQVNVTFTPQQGAGSARGYLNYYELVFPRTLQRYGAQTSFRAVASVGRGVVAEFEVGNCTAQTEVWDVTNPLQPRRQTLSAGTGARTFTAATDSLREFVVFEPGEVGGGGVRGFGGVPPQNLHAFNTGAASAAEQLDLVIVTHPSFLVQARRLAEFRSAHDGLQVAVATIGQVYNEFSSGRQDVTAIRDLMKMVYDRATDLQNYPVNLLLFGDASYDYKSNKWYAQRTGSPSPPTPDNTNYVPTYESRESVYPLGPYSGGGAAGGVFSSEDYYVILDDTEGGWNENSNNELVDAGVGRLPAYDETTAQTMVDKLLHYEDRASFGKWRNTIGFVADDADGSSHASDAEALANTYIDPAQPSYTPRKVYLDMFEQVSVPSGQRSPDAYSAIDRAVDQGALLINYTGHGGETGWTAERILDVPQINNWRNYDRLTFMLTATCEFGRYDDPRRASGAEYALYNQLGGAVGMMTTTRPVFQSENQQLNRAFFGSLFTRVNGQMPRLGDVYWRTKRQGNAPGSRNFALLGDPSMRLAYPELKAVVNTLTSDTLRALSTVQMGGSVLDAAGQPATGFNGRIQVTVYEKDNTIRTRGDEGSTPLSVKVRDNVVYDGVATVTAGQWQTRFVVPKDINYAFGNGRISLYAWTNEQDAAGMRLVTVGGSDSTAARDTTPPTVRLFMDDLSFVAGGLTGTDATLLATLRDTSGINTAGTGIGHEITATLDGRKDNVLVLNQYYTADVDSYTSGKVKYLFKGLTPGPHTVSLKAWDTFNNSAETKLDFVVAHTEQLALDHVLNYPNPFANATTFHFDHNRAGDDLDVQVQVFTVTGRLVRTLNTQVAGSPGHVGDLAWNGRDEFGDVLARGVYVYKINVRSERDGSHTAKYEKLVILN